MRKRQTTLGRFLAAALLALTLAAACAPTTAGPGPLLALAGTDWDLVRYGGREPLPGAPVTLGFSETEVSGSAGCNHYFGSYTLEETKLALGPLGSTVQWCDQGMEQEQTFLKMLGVAKTVTLEGNQLTLDTPEGKLVFRPAVHTVLEGTTWTLAGIAQGETVVETWLDNLITARFEEGKLTGSAGCNSYFAGYQVEGETLTLGLVGSTLMECDNEVMERERAFLAALDNVARQRIQRDTLTLLDAEGKALVALRAEKAPTAGVAPDALLGVDWDLLELAGEAPLPGSTITLLFSEDGISGSAGCNHYFGSYTLTGNALSISQVGNTEMWCEGRMEQEQTFLRMLGAAESLAFAGDHLTIDTAEGKLVFRPAVRTVLEGTAWTLAGIAQGEAVVETWLDNLITARFEEGKLTGSAGCNSFFAEYQAEGESLTLGPIGRTEMACDEERNQREASFLAALEKVGRYTIRRDALTLLDTDGDVLLMFGVPASE